MSPLLFSICVCGEGDSLQGALSLGRLEFPLGIDMHKFRLFRYFCSAS